MATGQEEIARTLSLSHRRELLAIFVESLANDGWFTSCLNCHYWNGENDKTAPETCGHPDNGGRRPPARIIISGCPAHSDTVPFP